jgi:probable rRNA maturation factor
MLTHGVYHILGYDHENNENAMIMENKEIQTLKKINIGNPY